MAYHTQAQVESEARYTFNATSKVTATKLAEIIAETDATINSRLFERYVTPVTGTEALIVLRKVALDITVGRVEAILRRGRDQAEDQNDESKKATTSRLASGMAALKRLAEGADILTDASRRDAGGDVAYNEDVERSADFGDDMSEDLW